MPSQSQRPRGLSGTHPPKSERQQMALLMQMTNQPPDSGASSSGSSTSTNLGGSGPGSTAGGSATASSIHQPGANIVGGVPARHRDKNGRGESSLHVAAIKGDYDTVKKLLDQGLNPNVSDNAGWTPLHEACNHGHINVATLLVKAGANVNAKGYEDVTPLHDAALVGQIKLVKLLVERGADPMAKNAKGKTPCDVSTSSVYGYLKDAAAANRNSSPSAAAPSPSSSVAVCIALTTTTSSANVGNSGSNASSSSSSTTLTSSQIVGSGSGGGLTSEGMQHKSLKSNESMLGGSNLNPAAALSAGKAAGGKATDDEPKARSGGGGGGGDSLSAAHGGSKGDEIYEFKTEKERQEEKLANEKKVMDAERDLSSSTSAVGGGGAKRTFPMEEDSTEIGQDPDEMRRKKLRKEDQATISTGTTSINQNNASSSQVSTGVKDSTQKLALGRASVNVAQQKGLINHGVTGHNKGLNSSLTVPTSDRKSPCPSPNPTSVPNPVTDSVVVDTLGQMSGADDSSSSKSSDHFNANAPKVPPLKIVIPQQNDQDTSGARKNQSTRNISLPYVVASSNSNDSSTGDKESSSSRCNSPIEGGGNVKKGAKEDSLNQSSVVAGTTASGGNGASEGNSSGTDRVLAPRVLRSSHRSSVGPNIDRNSNNASPQLQSRNTSSPLGGDNNSNTSSNSGVNNPTTSCTANSANNSGTQATGNATGGGGSGQQPQLSPLNVGQDQEGSTSNAPTTVAAGSSTGSSGSSQVQSSQQKEGTVDVHPRKRKIRASKDDSKTSSTNPATQSTSSNASAQSAAAAASSNPTSSQNTNQQQDNQDQISSTGEHPHDQPITCYQMFLNIRRQIERRQKNLFLVQPKPPQGFKDYLMNRKTYVLAGKASMDPTISQFPANITHQQKDLYSVQEKERHKLKMRHVVEKEKLVLSVEQEILRVHGRAARALANQSLPFSVCTILKDEEVYNMLTPEQEEKDRNARSRYNGRLFLSWLQDVDDKWEKIKEAMLLRHHNEAESLHAVQKMDWEGKMKELSLCEFKAKAVIEEQHVPIVHVSDDFDLLPP